MGGTRMTGMNYGTKPGLIILLILVLIFPLVIPAQAGKNDSDMSSGESPETLYINSNLKWASAYIEFPEGGRSAFEIIPNSVKISHINHKALVSPIYKEGPSKIGDNNDNGTPDLMVNFDMKKLAKLLDAGRLVELTYSGKMRSGGTFTGRSIVMIVGK
jgi:hypothetical protein